MDIVMISESKLFKHTVFAHVRPVREIRCILAAKDMNCQWKEIFNGRFLPSSHLEGLHAGYLFPFENADGRAMIPAEKNR